MRMYKHPNEGGCWFCHEIDHREMWFSNEFDCNFHPDCLHEELSKADINPEAEIIAREHDIEVNAKEPEPDCIECSKQSEIELCELEDIVIAKKRKR